MLFYDSRVESGNDLSNYVKIEFQGIDLTISNAFILIILFKLPNHEKHFIIESEKHPKFNFVCDFATAKCAQAYSKLLSQFRQLTQDNIRWS